MDHMDLMQPTVRRFMAALARQDRQALGTLLAADAALTDDGEPFPPMTWLDREVFSGDGRLEVVSERDDGTALAGGFTPRRWSLDTVWRFTLQGEQVARLDVSAA